MLLKLPTNRLTSDSEQTYCIHKDRMCSFLVSSGDDMLDTVVTFLNKAESDTLALREGDLGVFAGTDGEDVRKTGGEGVAS